MSEPPSPGRHGAPGVVVVVDDDQTDHEIDPVRVARRAEDALGRSGVHRGELTLAFVDEAAIAALNREHMGADGATDVLSFPLDADLATGELPADQPVLLGDIVICPAVAARTAPRRLLDDAHPGHPDHDGTLDAELDLLVVHGVLHLLGMDHADPADAAAMQARERELLGGLIVEAPAP